jgi:hypothetical protein
MLEGMRIPYGLANAVSIFYMASKIANSRIEDIAKRILSQE